MPLSKGAVAVGAVATIAVAAAAAVLINKKLKARSRARQEHTLVWSKPLDELPEGEPVLLMACQALVGEGVNWDPDTQTLRWLDINGQRLYFLNYSTREVVSYGLPKRASVACLRKYASTDNADMPLLMAFEDGFAFYNAETGKTKYLPGDYVQEGNIRLNDGRCDRQGRLICGGVNLDHIDEPLDVWHPKTSTYQISDSLEAKLLLLGPHRCYNATCFSPDGRTMYMADTPLKKVLAYDYDPATGRITSEPRVLIEFKGEGCPDGATVDANGNLWVAEFWAGRVTCVRPDGTIARSINIPNAKRTTCPCIGGPQLDTLFVTTACVGMSNEELAAQPWAGGLVAIKLGSGERGLPEVPFSF